MKLSDLNEATEQRRAAIAAHFTARREAVVAKLTAIGIEVDIQPPLAEAAQ